MWSESTFNGSYMKTAPADNITELQPFRVLALDGGGMRGLYTATILFMLARHFARQRNEDTNNIDIGAKFDLITGTSTGGILAAGLAAGIEIEQIIDLYKKAGKKIFPPLNCQPEGVLLFQWIIRFLRRPSAKQKHLKRELELIFGTKTLGDIYRERGIALCIPAVNAIRQKPRVFKTPHNPRFTRDPLIPIVDVCLATSAAPFFLPLAPVPHPDTPDTPDICVDGGLWANNPILVGLSESLELAKPDQPLEIISVSTCSPPAGKSIATKHCRQGAWHWKFGSQALLMSLEAQAEGHFEVAKIIARNLNRKCTLIRLPHETPSKEDSKHFGLDRAYGKALSILENQAKNDFSMILSKIDAHNDDKYLQALKEIF